MKTITKQQRTLNIISKAIENGYVFDETDSIENTQVECEDFLIENEINVREEECKVKSLGNHGQRVDWSDGMGYTFWQQGEILDYSNTGKIFHNIVIDSEGCTVKLFMINN